MLCGFVKQVAAKRQQLNEAFQTASYETVFKNTSGENRIVFYFLAINNVKIQQEHLIDRITTKKKEIAQFTTDKKRKGETTSVQWLCAICRYCSGDNE